MARLKLGELLIKARLLQPNQLDAALREQQRLGGRLGEVLVRMNAGLEDVIVRALSKQLNFPAVDLNSFVAVPREVLAKLSRERAHALQALPLQLRDENQTLVVAMADPDNIQAVEALGALSGCRISPYITSRSALNKALERFYPVGSKSTAPVLVPPSALAPAHAPEAAQASTGSEAASRVAEIESVQRMEVGTLKVLVELMIEKGVFTREEYLAKVRRTS